MAITRTLLGESGSEGTGLTTTTVSFTPVANDLILMSVLNWDGTAGQNDIPTVTGNGLTWVQVNTVALDSNRGRLTVFRAMGASASTGAATITFPTNSQGGVVYQVADYAGIDTTGTNGSGAVVQSVTNSTAGATSLSASLAALASASNFGAAASCHVANEPETPGGGATNLVRDWFGTPVTLSLMWEDNANVTTPAASWTTSAPAAMVALEIAAPSAAGQVWSPHRMPLGA